MSKVCLTGSKSFGAGFCVACISVGCVGVEANVFELVCVVFSFPADPDCNGFGGVLAAEDDGVVIGGDEVERVCDVLVRGEGRV